MEQEILYKGKQFYFKRCSKEEEEKAKKEMLIFLKIHSFIKRNYVGDL